MNEWIYSCFQDFCRKMRKACPSFSFGREEAWERGVSAVSSKVHDCFHSGEPFGEQEQEAFYKKKDRQYQGKYKETYLEAVEVCLNKLRTMG